MLQEGGICGGAVSSGTSSYSGASSVYTTGIVATTLVATASPGICSRVHPTVIGTCLTDMLRVGLDFYDTVSAHPKEYRELAAAVLASGGSVYIISAIRPGYEKRLRSRLRRTHVPYTDLHVVLYSHFSEIPKLKKVVIASLHLDFYIDDMGSTISALSELPVIGLLGK